MKLKVDVIRHGPGPSEAVVAINKADGGREQVVVHEPSIRNGLEVAEALARSDDRLLIELPRESTAGNWRVWVREDEVLPSG